MAAEKLTVVFQTQIAGSGKTPYDVYFYSDGSNYCTCPGWRFKKDLPAKERHCKHTIKTYQIAQAAVDAGLAAVPSDEDDLA